MFGAAVPATSAAGFEPPPPPPPEQALSHSVARWLDSLPEAVAADSEDYPPTLRQRMFYGLATAHDQRGAEILTIPPRTASLLKDGSLGGNERDAALPTHPTQPMPRYARPSDRIPLLRLGLRVRGTRSFEDDPEDTLRRVLATGRARF